MKTMTLCMAAMSGLIFLAGCGEKPQTSKTAGNDVAPYQGATNGFVAPGWKPGDKGSWEQSLKVRAQSTQNEYSKTQ